MLENFQQRWKEASNGVRLGFIVGLLAIIVFAVWAAIWATRDDYQVLFSDLDPADAATIVGELERMKVAYQLEEGGKSILVDRETVYKTRLKLMGKGVNLRGTVGFEIFNNTDFGTTEFAQKINYQRALQGELARTIMDFDEIKFARVHLVMPETGLFKKSNVKPKASISLIMKGDSKLNHEQVEGIQRLVAASVPEIDSSSVTILDQRGVALTRASDEVNEVGLTNARLELKKEIETYLTRKVVDILDKLVGAGKAIVSVDATLTQDHVKTTREDVIPSSTRNGESAGSVVRRRQSHQSSAKAAEVIALEPSGDLPGLPPLPRPTGAQGSGTLEIEYQNGRKVEQTVSAPGNIRRISVGVLLPDDVLPQQVEKIREVVSMAVGMNSARGDSIAVYSIEQFAARERESMQVVTNAGLAKEERDMPATDATQPWGNAMLWILLTVVFAGITSVTLWRGLRRSNTDTGGMPYLTEAERMAALTHVREWLNGSSVVLNNEAKT